MYTVDSCVLHVLQHDFNNIIEHASNTQVICQLHTSDAFIASMEKPELARALCSYAHCTQYLVDHYFAQL